MYQAVLFDLDGTLLDTLGDLAAAGNHALHAAGYPQHDVDAYRHFVGDGIPKLVERMLPPDAGAGTRQVVLSLFLSYYDAHKADRTAPYPGISALLASLCARGVQLGVVSNKDDALAKAIVQHYFPDVFCAVAGRTPDTPTKPDPLLVNAMRAQLNLPCRAVLYVGDSNIDVYTAHNAQLACCGAAWGFRGEQELRSAGAEYVAATPEELGALLFSGGELANADV